MVNILLHSASSFAVRLCGIHRNILEFVLSPIFRVCALFVGVYGSSNMSAYSTLYCLSIIFPIFSPRHIFGSAYIDIEMNNRPFYRF